MLWYQKLQVLPRCCIAAALPLSILLGGCSIHPLIDDIAPLNTVAVVTKLRCEIRTAIKKEASNLISYDPISKNDPERAKWLIEVVERQDRNWLKIVRANLSPESRILIDRYDGALIFMDFTFMNTEDNNNDTNINLLSTLMRGTDALNIKASNNRSRSSTRNFRTQDSFAGILTAPLTCEGRSRSSDYLYPVTGEIGLYEVINTFLLLNEGRSLIGGVVPKDRLFADTLVFSTTISGTLGPKITLSPVGKAIGLADAAFTSTNSRTDMHTVIVGLSLPQEEKILTQTPTETSPNTYRRASVVTNQSTVFQSNKLNTFLDEQVQRNLIMQLPTLIRPRTVQLF